MSGELWVRSDLGERAANLLLLLIVAVAALLRLYGLGELSFYGDEETTALAVLGFLDDGMPSMPTGLPYLRSVPTTLLSALSVTIFGDVEWAYRLPSAIAGTLTVLIVYGIGARITGSRMVGLIAAALLAASELHLVHSRMARMYALFALSQMLTFYLLLRWIDSRRMGIFIGAVITACLGVIIHQLGVMAVLFFVLLPFFSFRPRVGIKPIVAGTAIVTATFVVTRSLIKTGYAALGPRPPTEVVPEALTPISAADWLTMRLEQIGPIALLVLATAAVGLFFDIRRDRERLRDFIVVLELIAISVGVVALALFGSLHFLILLVAGAALLSHQPPHRFLLAWRGGLIGAALGTLIIIGGSIVIAADPLAAAVSSVKAALRFPFPYEALYVMLFPLESALVLVAVLGFVWLYPWSGRDSLRLRLTTLGLLAGMAALGSASYWGEFRYTIHLYPLFIVLTAVGLVVTVSTAGRAYGQLRRPLSPPMLRSLLTFAAILLLILLPHHGLRGAFGAFPGYTGWRNENLHLVPFKPDHRGLAEYVSRHAGPDDPIIAVDVIQQRYYLGHVDYFFRSLADARKFLFVSPRDSAYRDIYTGSQLLADTARIRAVACQYGSSRPAWLITSAETYGIEHLFLNEEQRAFLENHEDRRVFTAADGLAGVYRLDCEDLRASGEPADSL